MAMRGRHPAQREQRRTALLVGEGLAEQVFLNHLKALYVLRGVKSVTIKNAKGKGGATVLDFAIRQWQQAAYDEVGALLDTDAQWSDAQRALARRKQVQVFESDPCLEALLLRVAGLAVPAGDSAAHKRAFKDRWGAEAHNAKVYEKFFGLAILDAARERVPELEAIVEFLQR
ncbi:RloB domain-containing protein [Ideonella sp.]|uniref:RloB domain-containing protein n=1 Tax=Ideonella sp. TaxID=1929293 RepID=UPI003BB64528